MKICEFVGIVPIGNPTQNNNIKFCIRQNYVIIFCSAIFNPFPIS